MNTRLLFLTRISGCRATGGHLVLSYPNAFQLYMLRRLVAEPEQQISLGSAIPSKHSTEHAHSRDPRSSNVRGLQRQFHNVHDTNWRERPIFRFAVSCEWRLIPF